MIVDDEPDLCEILRFNFTSAGYEASTAYSAEEVLSKGVNGFDLLLLDVMLGGMSGFELAKHLKASVQTNTIPIIFLTAKDTEEDTLHGFSLGADDYVSKPFSVREVIARVGAVLHRSESVRHTDGERLSHGGLSVSTANKCVSVDGTDVPFTRTEYDLLLLLMSHPDQVFSRLELIEKVWPQEVVVTDRTVDVNITRIRKKIGPYARCIGTRSGFGYYFKGEGHN